MLETVEAQVQPVIPTDLAENPYEHLDAAMGAVVGVLPFDAAVMDAAPHLVVIARTGIGYDSVDVAAATERRIAVCNAPDGPTISTAEQAITLALTVAKSVRASADRLATGEDDLYARHEAMEFDDKTMGIVGMGRIGRRVAQIAAGFGMTVVAHDPFVTDAPAGVELVETLDEVLGVADVVSVHIPMSPDTAHICGREFFETMKPGATFVNTARGGLVDQDALLAAVGSGHLFGAGLDVTEPEPLPVGHPLLTHPRITVTPHVAAGTTEARYGNFAGAFDGVVSIINGERPINLVNADAWGSIEARIKESA